MNPSPQDTPPNARTARRIAGKIANDIEGRCGLGDVWGDIEKDIQRQILLEWAEIIEGELSR